VGDRRARRLFRRTAVLIPNPPDPQNNTIPAASGALLKRSTTMAKPPVRKPKKKVCVFCQERMVYVDYKDTGLLRKYISDRGKIRARRVTGNCTRHQRDVATAIKNAREMALLPYTSTAR
jgi:small subunit ribosomal protein S18